MRDPIDQIQEIINLQPADALTQIAVVLGYEERSQPAACEVEPLVRYCPGCGSVGPVEEKFRDCCPDGNEARMIPQALAEKCRDTFRVAVKTLLADAAACDASGAGAVPVPPELASRIIDALGRFTGDEGWKQADIGTADDLSALLAAPGAKPLFWYRPCSNGLYEGPIHDATIEEVRKLSGAWVPLFPGASSAETAETAHGFRIWKNKTDGWWNCRSRSGVGGQGWTPEEAVQNLVLKNAKSTATAADTQGVKGTGPNNPPVPPYRLNALQAGERVDTYNAARAALSRQPSAPAYAGDVELPPLPPAEGDGGQTVYVDHWYDTGMQNYARAAVLDDRQKRAQDGAVPLEIARAVAHAIVTSWEAGKAFAVRAENWQQLNFAKEAAERELRKLLAHSALAAAKPGRGRS